MEYLPRRLSYRYFGILQVHFGVRQSEVLAIGPLTEDFLDSD